MLKLILMMIFISSICFMQGLFWMVHNLLFIITFVLILMNFCLNYFVNISYFMGFDVLSYGLILLSFWICSLMTAASESVNKYNNYKNLFLFNVLNF